MENDFIHKMTETVDANLHNEHFGPEELAWKMGMSHSALHRKVKNVCNKIISRFIRERRLEKSKELLQNENLSVSEIAYKVGFGSATYFNKCFHEKFGESPGEFRKRDMEVEKAQQSKWKKKRFHKAFIFIVTPVILILVIWGFFSERINISESEKWNEKSIAIRPFNYLGGNSEKEYLANAMMLEIVNQLSQLRICE